MERLFSWAGYGALLLGGAVLYLLCRGLPADLPVFLPWEFHWPEYLAIALALAWWARGQGRAAPQPVWRRICFAAGVTSFYVVLQTHVDYYAQHMFFAHRWAHFVLHHAGAFAIALGMGGEALFAGMPDFLKPLVTARPVLGAVLLGLDHLRADPEAALRARAHYEP